MLRRAITLATSSLFLAASLADSAFAAPQDFVSNWVNTNPKTRQITRFAIKLTPANTLSIKIFELGNCVPKFDCDRGTTQVMLYNVQGSNHQFARAAYGKGLSYVLLILDLSGVGPNNLSRRIVLQKFTPDSSNQKKMNSSQEIFMPTKQTWPLPSPCFFQDPHRCSTQPAWNAPPVNLK